MNPLTTLKVDVFAEMPMARERAATRVTTGVLVNIRAP
jgi:hypothetical protein